MSRALAISALLLHAAAAAASSSDDAWVSRRLSEAGTQILEARFGPGRARFVAEARASRVVKVQENERLIPVLRGGDARELYVAGRPPRGVRGEAPGVPEFYHRESERTRREEGWTVTSLRGALMLPADASESDASSALATVSDLIGFDPLRGDEISIARVSPPLPPVPESRDWRGLAGLFAAVLLLAAWMLASSLPRAARALAGRLAPVPPAPPPPARAGAPRPERRIVPLPELGRAREGGLDGGVS